MVLKHTFAFRCIFKNKHVQWSAGHDVGILDQGFFDDVIARQNHHAGHTHVECKQFAMALGKLQKFLSK